MMLLPLLVVICSCFYASNAQRCERIGISKCANILPYKNTSYQSLLGLSNARDAQESFDQYASYSLWQCNKHMVQFVCAAHAPPCRVDGLGEPVSPCRSFCQAAKANCEGVIETLLRQNKYSAYGDVFDCNLYRDDDDMCMKVPEDTSRVYECPSPMLTSSSSQVLPLSSGSLKSCGLKCDREETAPVLLDTQSRGFLRSWTAGWAIASGVFGLFVMFTFLVNSDRFSYPMRPLIYMSCCYLAVAVVYLIGSYSENTFSCGTVNNNYLVNQGGQFVLCSLLGAVLYYFTLAAALWWSIMGFSWFLSSKLQWGAESIWSLSPYFHIFAWGLPFVSTVAALAVEAIDGDLLTGTCSIGNLQPSTLLHFVVYPLLLAICLGVLFTIIAIRALFQLHQELQNTQPEMDLSHFQRLIARLTFFSIVYTLVSVVGSLVLWYQAAYLPEWIEGWYSRQCLDSNRTGLGFSMESADCPRGSFSQPGLLLFLAKYTTQLSLGIVCAAWLVNYKTIDGYLKRLGCVSSRYQDATESNSFRFVNKP